MEERSSVAREHWARRLSRDEIRPGTVARYERVLDSFMRFVHASGATDLTRVDECLCRQFVYAPLPDGTQPAPSSSRFRLTVVRDALTVLSPGAPDPTARISVAHPPHSRSAVPLTPAEAARLRNSGRISPRDHLRPTVVELALVGGSHAEIAVAVIADVDLDRDRVRLGQRWAHLDTFAAAILRARIAACRRSARRTNSAWDTNRVALAMPRPLDTYPNTSFAPGISRNLTRALAKAGVNRPGVRATSVREYGANLVYAMTERAEDVAGFLGLESLDAAMGYISPEWQHKFRDEVRR